MQITPRQAYIEVGQNGKSSQSDSVKTEEATTESLQQLNKKQFNAAILQGAIDQADQSSSSITTQPLSLVLKTALQSINDALQEVEPTQSVQQSYQSEIDFSPEATAERIISFSTNFFSAYQAQHPELEEQAARDTFTEMMIGAVEEGVGEAKNILASLSVLEGDVAVNIEKTMELISQGFENFRISETKSDVEGELNSSSII